MMRNLKKIITIVFLLVSGIVTIVYVMSNEKKKQYPLERYHEEQEEQEENGDTKDTDMDETGKTILTQGNVSYEFISYDVLEESEILTQTRYPADNFQEEPGLTYTTFIIDYEGLFKEAPELEPYFTRRLDFEADEVTQMREKYSDTIRKYTFERYPQVQYYFFNMRIENLSEDRVVTFYPDFHIIQTNEDMNNFTYSVSSAVYFSHSQNREGEARIHRFTWYDLQPGEILECTIGYCVEKYELIPDPMLYVGFMSVQMQNEWVNPALSKSVISLQNVPRK